jgi:glycosyltransferase involved in cell wall biosynthesis
MNILYISFCAPYDEVGHAGGKTFNYYIKELTKQKNVNIELVSLCDDIETANIDCDKYGINTHKVTLHKGMRNIIGNILSINSKFNPFSKYCGVISRKSAKLVLKRLRQLADSNYSPDIVVMEWTQITLLVTEIKKIYPNAKYIASEHDVIFQGKNREANQAHGLKRYYKQLLAQNTFIREQKALGQCDRIIVQNNKDKVQLSTNGIVENKITVIAPYYHKSLLEHKRENNNILFFGYMKRRENIEAVLWFIDNVMPRLTDIPCDFIVLGGGGKENVGYLESNKVKIIGFVDEIDKWFASAMCFVSPLTLGAGIKVKILEALYSGIPVLTNQIGIEGIPAEAGRDYIHCEAPEDYEKAIRNIYLNKKENGHVDAKELINSCFSMEESTRKYIDTVIGAVNQ